MNLIVKDVLLFIFLNIFDKYNLINVLKISLSMNIFYNQP